MGTYDATHAWKLEFVDMEPICHDIQAIHGQNAKEPGYFVIECGDKVYPAFLVHSGKRCDVFDSIEKHAVNGYESKGRIAYVLKVFPSKEARQRYFTLTLKRQIARDPLLLDDCLEEILDFSQQPLLPPTSGADLADCLYSMNEVILVDQHVPLQLAASVVEKVGGYDVFKTGTTGKRNTGLKEVHRLERQFTSMDELLTFLSKRKIGSVLAELSSMTLGMKKMI